MASEKFCLRWNDFERNISSAFKDIRDEKEFFDITIACEDEQLQAHKVILSACSPFFRSVLRRNQPGGQQGMLVLYLKGVTYRDMESVLNFMYHGEVNVAQDDLNSFLAVAEDLKVKGLTQNNSSSSSLPSKSSGPPGSRRRPSDEQGAPSAQKRPRPNPLPRPNPPQASEDDDEIQEYVPVKSEPIAQPQQQQEMAMYEDPNQPVAQGGMMMATEGEQYEENYGDYEEGYDGAYYQDAGGQDSGAGTGMDRAECKYCGKWLHKRGLKRHIKDVHDNEDVDGASNCHICKVCQKNFKTEQYLKNHLRVTHNIYQQQIF